MGVKGLWKILEPSARRISLDNLNGLVLAVDVSIWLNQAIKSAGDSSTASNAHLLLLFHRICKLLFYRIKPVFVFDGPSPPIKLRTLQARRKGRKEASKKASNLLGRHTLKVLEAHALAEFTGAPRQHVASKKGQRLETDMFQLPQLPTDILTRETTPLDEEREGQSETIWEHSQMVAKMDIGSSYFSSLPPEVQHDLLLEKKELEKHTHTPADYLPEKADAFSDYQLQRLLKRSQLSRKLEDVRTTMKTDCTAAYGLSDMSVGEVEASRIASSDTGHYILIRAKDLVSSSQDANSGDLEQPVLASGGGFIVEDDTTTVAETLPTVVVADVESISSGSVSPRLSRSEMREQLEAEDIQQHDSSILESIEANLDQETTKDLPYDLSVSTGGEIERVSPVIVEDSVSEVEDKEQEEESSLKQVPINIPLSSPVAAAPFTSTSDPLVAEEDGPLVTDTLEEDGPLVTDTLEEDGPLVADALEEDGPLVADTLEEDGPLVADTLEEDGPLVADTLEEDEVHEAMKELQQLYQLPGDEAQRVLREEIVALEEQVGQQEKRAAQVSDWMYQDAQELLSLFGIPYIVSPSEAEAQCAALELLSLTDGCITNDSDVFLFGGQKVYRHFFDQHKDIELYSASEFEKMLGLNRDKLIVLAYLLGSDYTEGLEGIGHVHAMEILRDFAGEGIEPLKKLKLWWDSVKENPQELKPQTALSKKLGQLDLTGGFPDEEVWSAYFKPLIDNSEEVFEWAMPDLDLLRQFAQEKFGWSASKANEILLPVLRSLRSVPEKQVQPCITSYVSHEGDSQRGILKSKRMQRVVASLTGKEEPARTAPPTRKRKKGELAKGKKGEGPAKRKRGGGKARRRRSQSDNKRSLTISTLPLSASSSSSTDEQEI